MKDFGDYYQLVSKAPSGTSAQVPKVRHYVAVKLVDNVSIVLLVALTIGFTVIGLMVTDADRSKWALNAAMLCLGVFLGLFAGKRGTK